MFWPFLIRPSSGWIRPKHVVDTLCALQYSCVFDCYSMHIGLLTQRGWHSLRRSCHAVVSWVQVVTFCDDVTNAPLMDIALQVKVEHSHNQFSLALWEKIY